MSLFEARRNPELNPKIDILTELTKYAGDDDVFVSFTSGFNITHGEKPVKSGPRSKIGVNPKSEYNTPLGIYCYPLDYVIRYSRNEGKVSAPFTGGSPWKFLYVVRRKKQGYVETDADAEPFYEKLKTMVMGFFPEEDYARNFILSAEESAKEETTRGYLWNLARILSQNTEFKEIYGFTKAAVAWNYIMRSIGCMQWVDRRNEGLIHSNEPTQSVFFTITNFNVIDVFPSPKNRVLSNETFDKIISAVISGKFNADNFDPVWIKKLGVSSEQIIPVLEFLDERVKPVQRKAIGAMLEDIIDTYYIHDIANTLRLTNKFVDISPAIPKYTYLYQKLPDLADIERVMGRKMNSREWDALIISTMENGWTALYKSYVNDEKEFVTQYIKRWIELPRKFYGFAVGMDFLTKAVDKFGITFTDQQLVKLFYKAPDFTLENYPNIASKLTTADWVKAARTSGFTMISRQAPIDALKIIITAANNNRRFLAFADTQVALTRLLQANEIDFVLWALLNDRNLETMNQPELVEFIWKNINKLIFKMKNKLENSRNILTFMVIQPMPSWVELTPLSKKKLWVLMTVSRARGIEALLKFLKTGVFDLDYVKSQPDKEFIGRVYDQALRGEAVFSATNYDFLEKLDLEYLFEWTDKLRKSSFIAPRHLIQYFNRPPDPDYDRVADWSPIRRWEYPKDMMEKLVHIVPDMFRNRNIYEYLDAHVLYGGVIDGSIDYASLPDRERGLIWSAIIKEDMSVFEKLYYDPRFHPLPRYVFGDLNRAQRQELLGKPMPAEIVAKAISWSEGYEFLVKPNEEDKLVDLIIDGYQNTVDVATGRIRVKNLSSVNLFRIQRSWVDHIIKSVIHKTEMHMIIPVVANHVRRFLEATKVPTPELKAYVDKLSSAIAAQDIQALRSLGQNEIANLIPKPA